MNKYGWDDPTWRKSWDALLDGLTLSEVPLTLRQPIIIKDPTFVGTMNRLYYGEATGYPQEEE